MTKYQLQQHQNDELNFIEQDEFENANYWGLLTTIDLKNCNPEKIRSAQEIEKFVIKICDLIEVKRFGDPTIVHFGEDPRVSGYSLVQLIETSLVSGHFANETNSAYIDIFSCKYYNQKCAVDFCKGFFGAQVVNHMIRLRK